MAELNFIVGVVSNVKETMTEYGPRIDFTLLYDYGTIGSRAENRVVRVVAYRQALKDMKRFRIESGSEAQVFIQQHKMENKRLVVKSSGIIKLKSTFDREAAYKDFEKWEAQQHG